MKKLKHIDIFNIILCILIIVADTCYICISTSEYITKTIASGLFVVCGCINLIHVINNPHSHNENKMFKWWMMIGLCFACMGDLFLIDFFVLGVLFFALGHVFYFISFVSVKKFCTRDLLIGTAIILPSALLILLYKGFDFEGLQPVILIYALIISFMIGKAISNFCGESNNKNLLVMLGTIAFFISDLVLMFRLFAGWGRIGSIVCVIFYYPAQFLLAWSIEKVCKNSKIME